MLRRPDANGNSVVKTQLGTFLIVSGGELLIVKVDIEGFELDLFSQNTDWIAQAFTIIVEPYDWMLPGTGSSKTMQQAIIGEDRELLVMGENLAWTRH